MKWNAEGQKICIVYEDGKFYLFLTGINNVAVLNVH